MNEVVGKFTLVINDCVYKSDTLKEVLVIQDNNYINLALDIRFNIFGSFGKFDRELSLDELNTYNVYIARKNQQQPLWTLSTGQIVALKHLCLKLSKK